jgi:hypothetical protein
MPIIMKHTIVRWGEELVQARRRQNLYAKEVVGLQRSLIVQQLVHNWGATALGAE